MAVAGSEKPRGPARGAVEPAGALRISSDVTEADVEMSPVLRNAIILLEAASKGDGLKLTATGNLARAVVDDMRDRFEWPGYEKSSTLALYKVVNEPDFMPLHFIRITTAHAGLLRRRKGALTTTPAARELLSQQRFGPLQAILFHTALWRLDLSYFGRGLLGSWPQGDIGIVLWSLTVAAWDWQTPERLSRLCAVPTAEVVEPGIWDRGSLAFEARVLRPLFWFGLLERSAEKSQTHELVETHLYRKSPLFDRFLKFDVGIAACSGAGNA